MFSVSLRFLLRKSSGKVIVPNPEGFRRTKVAGLRSCWLWQMERQPRITQMKGILLGKKAFMLDPLALEPTESIYWCQK